METIQELRKFKEDYLNEQVEKIVQEVKEDDDFCTTRATCDARYWDNKLHTYMPQIASKLREQGFEVSSKINHGVTDWTIILK